MEVFLVVGLVSRVEKAALSEVWRVGLEAASVEEEELEEQSHPTA